MRPSRSIAFVLAGLIGATAGAQQISTVFGGTFVDISTTGGTAILGVGDDSLHGVTTTLGNAFFPAGPITISNNGAVTGMASGSVLFTNGDIPAAPANPTGISAGAGVLMPCWDDLYPQPGAANTTIYWQEVGGVLYIMWKNDNHWNDPSTTGGITFEIQVFNGVSGPCTPLIQYLYADTVFGGSMTVNDNGASATVGYAHGNIAALGNAKLGYNQPNTINPNVIVTLIEGTGGPFTLAAGSPLGSGSLQLDWTNGFTCLGGTYVLAVTLAPGAYPAGWLHGLDIGLGQLMSELNSGFPFVGPLGISGSFTFGPIGGVPSGLPFWAVSLGIPAGGSTFTIHTPAIAYTVP
jgi:hypothetical protein